MQCVRAFGAGIAALFAVEFEAELDVDRADRSVVAERDAGGIAVRVVDLNASLADENSAAVVEKSAVDLAEEREAELGFDEVKVAVVCHAKEAEVVHAELGVVRDAFDFAGIKATNCRAAAEKELRCGRNAGATVWTHVGEVTAAKFAGPNEAGTTENAKVVFGAGGDF